MADTAWLGTAKPIIAMVHLPPLPGSPGYDPAGGMAAITDSAASDIEALQDGGVDAVMFGNEGDRPYELAGSTGRVAAMAAAVATLKPLLKVPFGVNFLWDPLATVALGAATGAAFAREIFTGLYAADMGLWEPRRRAALELRARARPPRPQADLQRQRRVLDPLDTPPDRGPRQSAVFSSLADVIAVSGPMTGEGVDAPTSPA